MPIYEYQCSSCNYHMEELQNINEQPLTRCPRCKKNTLKRLIGSGAGIIFKGSGFYETDYKRSASKRAASPKTSVSTSEKAEEKKETKAKKK
jgi:putative FmdB family regulatory protein